MHAVGSIGPRYLQIAWGELGVREVPGHVHAQRVLEYHSATRLKATDDETPWCSAFVNWALREGGLTGTLSAAARSWLTWGREVHAVEPGCIGVFVRGSSASQGHVAFPVGVTAGGDIVCLGGNQGNSVSVAIYPLTRLIGLRMPV